MDRVHLWVDVLSSGRCACWRVQIIHTGSAVPGFSQNPKKGKALEPTRVTNPDGSDVDISIAAVGVAEWAQAIYDAGNPDGVLRGDPYPTTMTRETTGYRIGVYKPALMSPSMADWLAEWAAKLPGGVQITVSVEADPQIPPWETLMYKCPA